METKKQSFPFQQALFLLKSTDQRYFDSSSSSIGSWGIFPPYLVIEHYSDALKMNDSCTTSLDSPPAVKIAVPLYQQVKNQMRGYTHLNLAGAHTIEDGLLGP